MVAVVCVILGAAFFLLMLSYLPWAQTNMTWLTSYKFVVLLGAVVSSGILYLLYRLSTALLEKYGGGF